MSGWFSSITSSTLSIQAVLEVLYAVFLGYILKVFFHASSKSNKSPESVDSEFSFIFSFSLSSSFSSSFSIGSWAVFTPKISTLYVDMGCLRYYWIYNIGFPCAVFLFIFPRLFRIWKKRDLSPTFPPIYRSHLSQSELI